MLEPDYVLADWLGAINGTSAPRYQSLLKHVLDVIVIYGFMNS